jgi:hypothetical protein
MRSVVVQPEAFQEIDDAVAWYEDKEAGLGLRFVHDLDILFTSMARRPETFPYAIFFESDNEIVVVHSVFHCSQNPAKWQARLKGVKKKSSEQLKGRRK